MSGEGADRIEAAVDGGAAVLLAAATAYALALLGASAAYSALGAAMALAGGIYGLRSVPREAPCYALARFAPAAWEFVDLPELVLTDEDRLDPPVPAGEAELVLDDILAELGPGARVVRLFDSAAMPSPAQLKDRIDEHLNGGPPAVPPDASQALYEALAELRRSLR